MQIRVCDRCKKQLPDGNPLSNVHFPQIVVRVRHGIFPTGASCGDGSEPVDLCAKCENDVYKFIFGGSDDGLDKMQ